MTNKEFRQLLEPIYELLMDVKPADHTAHISEISEMDTMPPFMFITAHGTSQIQMIRQVIFFLNVAEYLNRREVLDIDNLNYGLIRMSEQVLIDKAREYSTDESRFANFNTAIKYLSHPGHICDAIVNISSKHFAWVEDALCNRIEVTEKGIYDHIVDCINYIFIYFAALKELRGN